MILRNTNYQKVELAVVSNDSGTEKELCDGSHRREEHHLVGFGSGAVRRAD